MHVEALMTGVPLLAMPGLSFAGFGASKER
jgi:hypothetical protein